MQDGARLLHAGAHFLARAAGAIMKAAGSVIQGNFGIAVIALEELVVRLMKKVIQTRVSPASDRERLKPAMGRGRPQRIPRNMEHDM